MKLFGKKVSLFLLLSEDLCNGFKIPVHEKMTEEVLKEYSIVIEGEELEFTDKAIEEIKDSNAATDDIENQLFESKAHFHFDNEKLYKGSQRVRNENIFSMYALREDNPNGEEARKHLGGGMHTLQDFYAHSNWVDFNDNYNTDLGSKLILNPSTATQPCPNSVGTLEGAGLNSLTTGYFVLPTQCLLLGSPPLIYACAVYYCDDVPHPGKCRHGLEYTFCEGINKDETGRPGFSKARGQAKESTKDYLNKLINHSLITNSENRLEMVKALMGIENGDLVIVVDDTGSMGDDIAQVKSQVSNIVNNVGTTPGKYVLVRFGDPTIGSPYTTTDPVAFLAQVNALSPSGGGDCPELAMGGLLNAIGASSKNSNVFLFTDADAKDASLAPTVVAEAVNKDITIYAVLTGSCSRRRSARFLQSEESTRHRRLAADPVYEQVTASSGGQIFSVDRNDVGTIFEFLRFQLAGDFFTILSKEMHHSSMDTTTLEIPIDSTIDSFLVSVSTDDSNFDVSLYQPDGNKVVSGDANVTITEQARGVFYAINNPVAGKWNVATSAAGSFDILVRGKGSIRFPRFSFVEPRVTYGGLIYRPINGQPIAGSSPSGLASVSGPYASVDFNLVSTNGQFLASLDFIQGSELAAEDSWSGNVTLPIEEGFRVEAVGMDNAGFEFQRIYSELFWARSISMSIGLNNTSGPHLPYNQTLTTIQFLVYNHGDVPETFLTGGTNDRNLPMTLFQSSLLVGANASEAFELAIESPPAEDCVQDLSIEITVTVTSSSDTAVTNSAKVIRFTDCNFALLEDDPSMFDNTTTAPTKVPSSTPSSTPSTMPSEVSTKKSKGKKANSKATKNNSQKKKKAKE